MSGERKNSFAVEVKSERSLSDENLRLAGFGCNLCDWQIVLTEYFKALPQFGIHNNEKHLDTRGAHILHIYRQIKQTPQNVR